MTLVEWYSEKRTATALGVSTRTVRRMAEDGTLRRAYRPLKGRKPESVYHPEDVEREQQRIRRPAPVEDTQRPGPEPTDALRPGIQEALERFSEIMRHAPLAAPPLWMSIETAAEYSGLSQALLRRLVTAGILPAIGDHAIKIRRADLDRLEAAHLAETASLAHLQQRTREVMPAPPAKTKKVGQS